MIFFKRHSQELIMKKTLYTIGLALLMACATDDESTIPSNPGTNDTTNSDITQYEGYTLIWNDEFNDSEINTQYWNYETGDGAEFGLPTGWGNNELQIYTTEPSNSAIVKDGDLSVISINALRNGAGGYTSAKLTTEEKVSARFGRIEVRAKMPQGQGIWPAIWMLGDNRDQIEWPGCGEIDLVEVLGHEPNRYYSTLHYTNGDNSKGEEQQTHQLLEGSFSQDYHLYTLDWNKDSLTFSLDGLQLTTLFIEDDMKEFQRSFYFILNIAVGGYWPGNPDNTTTFPQSMKVDFIRVYSKDDYLAPAEPLLDIDEETLGGVLEENFAYHGIKNGFNDLGLIDIITFGSGGQPSISNSDTSISGTTSLVFDFPGGTWGGAWFEMAEARDLSTYTNLKFSILAPSNLHTAEIKLESPTSNAAIFLADYTPLAVGNGFVEYSIPLADFQGLTLTEVHIPFAFWNPQDINEDYVGGAVLIDNLFLE